MPQYARKMIAFGLAIPATVAALLVIMRLFDEAGRFAGGFMLMLLLIPATPATLVLLTGGTVVGGMALLRHGPAFRTSDYAILGVGAVGAVLSICVAARLIFSAIMNPA